jgi:hypothetical protein
MLFAFLDNVPVIGHPVFRILLGAALIAVGLALNLIYVTAVGALLLAMVLVRGAAALTGRTQKGQLP